jgi:reverse gyrase
MVLTIKPVYHAACPNCGGPISAERLLKGLPCRRCLPNPEGLGDDYYGRIMAIGEALSKRGVLKRYAYIYTVTRQLVDFERFFERIVGYRMWSAQRVWAKKMLQGESIAIVAPTGVGKTTLLSVYTVYRALQGGKVYYLLPTENLARQVYNKIRIFAEKVGNGIRIARYYSGLPRREKEAELEVISAGAYDVLVTTTAFLSRRWELVAGRRFDAILVDDVDAVLRNSKNIDRILYLLGFSENAVRIAYEIVKKKIAALVAKASGNMKKYEDLLLKLENLEARLARELVSSLPGQLVIASATGRAYGLKPKLFRELLGFDIGRVYDYTRSVANLYKVTSDPVGEAVRIVSEIEYPGLIFVAKRYGNRVARELVQALQERGVPAGLALAGRRVLERFEKDEYKVLVGVASYYGVIVRGIDMPQRVYYTLFIGVPSQMLQLEKALLSPHRIARAAVELEVEGADELARKLAKLSPTELTAIRIALANGEKLGGKLGEILEQLERVRLKVLEAIRAKLSEQDSIALGGVLYTFDRDGGGIVAIIPDAPTYVQASGRASRMYGSTMTHGVSIVLEVDEKLIELLVQRLRRFVEDVNFVEFTWPKLGEELGKAERSRKGGGRSVNIETSLIVVESPTKAKTIASFFGKPVRRRIGSVIAYETTFYNPLSGKIHVATITATAGHIYDLSIDGEGIHGIIVDGDVSPVYKPIKRCLSCGHQFSSDSNVCPRCGSANVVSKIDVIEALRQLAIESETVYIATDPDVEGEKIAYDIMLLVKPYARKVKRIELHEITRQELYRALAKPRDVDVRMAEAQMVRRIEDRWIGFGLSQHLWRVFGKNWLGAGRVQTPVLGWIIERYREWREHLGYNLYLKIEGAPLIKLHFESLEEARRVAGEVEEKGLLVADVEEELVDINPPPPYTTESLIYDASRVYGYPSQKTMRIAQELFEAGLITYHRTDSTHISPTGQAIAREYLSAAGLGEYFAARSWGPQGHHEAIRPVKPIDAASLRRLVALGDIRLPIPLRESHYRLYDLIFRRFIASQMKPAKLAKRRIRLQAGSVTFDVEVYTRAEIPGYHTIYPHPRVYPSFNSVRPGDRIRPTRILVKRGSTVYLYTHGELVSLMKQMGLGRPSTYAKIIEALERHGYVIESKYRKRLVPTKLGIEVYEYLTLNFPDIVSEERTRSLYAKIESVAAGKASAKSLVIELLGELEELLKEQLAGEGGGAEVEA